MKLLEKIKYVIRANAYYRQYCQTTVNDYRYLIRNIRYYLRFYSLRKDKGVTGNTLFFIIDPEISHPGLVDRFKAIVGSYYIAKINGFNFKIIFEHPFLLSNYLNEASTKWIATQKDLSYSLFYSRIIPYNGGGKVPKLNKKIKQYHIYCYIGYDILVTNNIPDNQQLWRSLFLELFSPTLKLETVIKEASILINNKYIAVHLRFVNALEQFEDYQYNSISHEKKEKLIHRCLCAIQNITTTHREYKIVLFSDSALFLKRVQQELNVIVLEGEIGHISFSKSENVILKTFIDFYIISNADHIISIKALEMYNSVFPYYGAILGGKKCEDYYV